MGSSSSSQFTSMASSLEGFRGKAAAGLGSAVSFSDDEDTTQMTGSKSTARGRRGSVKASSSEVSRAKTSTRGRGRGRGRGSTNLKQTTLDGALGIRHLRDLHQFLQVLQSEVLLNDDDVDSPSSEDAINEIDNSSEDEESVQGKGRKRAAPRGRGRGSTQSKHGKKTDNTPVYRMLMNQDDDDDDDDVTKRFNKPPPWVTRNYGALRRGN